MSNCPFQRIDPTTIRCAACGYEYVTETPADRVRRKCPAAADSQALEAERIRAALDERFQPEVAVRSRAAIDAAVSMCRACTYWARPGCRRVNDCRAFDRWITKLLYGRCDRWTDHAETQP
jgi:hypothetical protein